METMILGVKEMITGGTKTRGIMTKGTPIEGIIPGGMTQEKRGPKN